MTKKRDYMIIFLLVMQIDQKSLPTNILKSLLRFKQLNMSNKKNTLWILIEKVLLKNCQFRRMCLRQQFSENFISSGIKNALWLFEQSISR